MMQTSPYWVIYIPLYSPYEAVAILAKQLHFSFLLPEDTPSEMKVFVPVRICKLQSGFLKKTGGGGVIWCM